MESSQLWCSSNGQGSQNAVGVCERHSGAHGSLDRPRSIGVASPGTGGKSSSRQSSGFHNQREVGTETLERTTEDAGKGSSGLSQKS